MPIFSFIVFISAFTYLFFLRAPVVLLSDAYFDTVYGERHIQIGQLEASFRIFRQIKIARVSEDTSERGIIDAINSASMFPSAVFFPYSYSYAAEAYSKSINSEKSKIFILMNRIPNRDTKDDFYYVFSNTDIDFLIAGECAAILADEYTPVFDGANEAGVSTVSRSDKSVFFIYDEPIDEGEKDVFLEGLASKNFSGAVDYINGHERKSWLEAASVVVYGPAPVFLYSTQEVPTVLFSWLSNINYFPLGIKVHINDSPYIFIPQALKAAAKDADTRGFSFPSRYSIIKKNIRNKSLIPKLSNIIVFETSQL